MSVNQRLLRWNEKWGEEFENRSDLDKIIYLKKLFCSVNEALDGMQKERNLLLEEVQKQKALTANAQSALEISKQSMTKNITDSNAKLNSYIKQLQEYQNRIAAQDKVIEELNKRTK